MYILITGLLCGTAAGLIGATEFALAQKDAHEEKAWREALTVASKIRPRGQRTLHRRAARRL